MTCAGPSKLPELGRELGKSVKSFQTAAKVRSCTEELFHAPVQRHGIPGLCLKVQALALCMLPSPSFPRQAAPWQPRQDISNAHAGV